MATGQAAASTPVGHQMHLNGQAGAGAPMVQPEWDWTAPTGIPWQPTAMLMESTTPWARWVQRWARLPRPDLQHPARQHTEAEFRTGFVRNLYVLPDGALAIDTGIDDVASGLAGDYTALEPAYFRGEGYGIRNHYESTWGFKSPFFAVTFFMDAGTKKKGGKKNNSIHLKKARSFPDGSS